MGRNIFIGELSKRTGIPVKTIRYYEDLRILVSPKRTDSEYRIYSQQDVEKLLFIKKAKDLGLTLAEIKDILDKSGRAFGHAAILFKRFSTERLKNMRRRLRLLRRPNTGWKRN